jgi:hypothetical protein
MALPTKSTREAAVFHRVFTSAKKGLATRASVRLHQQVVPYICAVENLPFVLHGSVGIVVDGVGLVTVWESRHCRMSSGANDADWYSVARESRGVCEMDRLVEFDVAARV